MLELVVYHLDEPVSLELEHSLFTISKWESKHKKAFYGSRGKTPEEMLDYMRCMIMTPDVDRDLVFAFEPDDFTTVQNYIDDPMTASSIHTPQSSPTVADKEVLTSDLIYYFMTQLRIPFEADRWHIHRLLMLIEIISAKQESSSKKKPMNRAAAVSKYRELNAQRRKDTGSSG